MNALFKMNSGRQHAALAEEGCIDGLLRPGWVTVHDAEVGFFDVARGHGGGEKTGGGGVFGDENQPAGFAVEPVDDGNLAAIGDFKGEELSETVPQGERVVGTGRGGGMNEEMRRFIDDDPIGRFVEDAKMAVDKVGSGQRWKHSPERRTGPVKKPAVGAIGFLG